MAAIVLSFPMTDPNGAAIYGVPWIPSRNTPFMLVYIPYMDPMGFNTYHFNTYRHIVTDI